MIDLSTLPSWAEIYSHIGERPPGRKRGRCPIHGGDSFYSVALDEDKGVFYCHACHAGGDKISFVQQVHRCDFKDALRFFGLEPGLPPAPDPAMERRQRIRQGLQRWAHTLQRRLRDEFYLRSRIELFGKRRLDRDSEDRIGWELLAIAYAGIPLDELESWLDLLIGTEQQQLEVYKMMRTAA